MHFQCICSDYYTYPHLAGMCHNGLYSWTVSLTKGRQTQFALSGQGWSKKGRRSQKQTLWWYGSDQRRHKGGKLKTILLPVCFLNCPAFISIRDAVSGERRKWVWTCLKCEVNLRIQNFTWWCKEKHRGCCCMKQTLSSLSIGFS